MGLTDGMPLEVGFCGDQCKHDETGCIVLLKNYIFIPADIKAALSHA